MLTSNDGTITLNLYRKNGVFCAAPEELKQTGVSIVYDVITGDTLNELLLKLHARYNLAVEEIDLDTLFIEETS